MSKEERERTLAASGQSIRVFNPTVRPVLADCIAASIKGVAPELVGKELGDVLPNIGQPAVDSDVVGEQVADVQLRGPGGRATIADLASGTHGPDRTVQRHRRRPQPP